MSLLIKGGGITKLSELIIDAAPDKAKDIAELVLTAQGDVLYRDTEAAKLAAVLRKMPMGMPGYFCAR